MTAGSSGGAVTLASLKNRPKTKQNLAGPSLARSAPVGSVPAVQLANLDAPEEALLSSVAA